MHTIYCFINGRWGSDNLSVMAVGDDGTQLGSHISSSIGFAKMDIGHLPGTFQQSRHETFNKHFGEGNWRTEWVDEPREHPEIMRIADEQRKADKPKIAGDHAKVSITVHDA